MGRPRSIDRDKVLDIAERIVREEGATALTFDAVARAAGITKGSTTVGKGAAVGRVTMDQLREIAEIKMKDMNANDIDGAVRMLAGSARSMGLTVVEG